MIGNFKQLKVTGRAFVGDAVSGLVMAVVSVPGALANGVLAGVSEDVLDQLERTGSLCGRRWTREKAGSERSRRTEPAPGTEQPD